MVKFLKGLDPFLMCFFAFMHSVVLFGGLWILLFYALLQLDLPLWAFIVSNWVIFVLGALGATWLTTKAFSFWN